MTSVVSQYRIIKNNLNEIIKVSGYRNDYIARKLGISPQSFTVKKQRNSWNDEEVEKVLEIVDNEDSQDFILVQLMRSLEGEETLTLKEAKLQMGWK